MNDESVRAPGRTILRLEEHEGSLLYTDASGRDRVRTEGALTLTVYRDAQNKMQIGFHSTGYLPATIEALAAYYLATPGFKDAVDGMYELLLKQRRAGLPEPERK
jgi:hypothetical protein